MAAELGDGFFSAALPNAAATGGGTRCSSSGPSWTPARRRPPTACAAAGPAVAVRFHALYERGGAAAVDGLPGGVQWREALEALPGARRHLATHEGHLVALSDRDRVALAAGTADLIPGFTLTGEAGEIRARVEAMAAAGVTEVAFQPGGDDVARELEAFAAAVRAA